MILIPSTTDRHELCDWAELQAATSGRKAATQGDLLKVIQPDDSQVDSPGADDDESTHDELIADDVLSLAHERARVLGKAYPFSLERNVLRYSPKLGASSGRSYLFHLLFASVSPEFISPTARHQFEIESKYALLQFFGGESFHFGWTKHNANLGTIQKRIETLCSETTIGWTARRPVNVSPQNKDVGVDLLIWRHFSDRRANTLVLVGQCASGRDWPSKLATPAIRKLEDCLSETRNGAWVNCFCTPFHIAEKNWRDSARAHDGVICDRIRLVLATGVNNQANLGTLCGQRSIDWLSRMLADIESRQITYQEKRNKSRRTAKKTRRARCAA